MNLGVCLHRWGVVFKKWTEIGGVPPQLGPFIAGWYMKQMGCREPEDIGNRYRDSFRAGYHERETY